MRRALASVALALAAAGGLGGCQAPGLPSARFVLGEPVPTVPLAATARGPEAPIGAALALGLRAGEAPAAPGLARGLLALPATWTQAFARLSHASVLWTPRDATLRKDIELVATGTGAYKAANPFPGVLRPTTGYGLAVEIWDGDTTAGTLMSQKAVSVDLVGGVNQVTLTMDPVPALAISSFSPTSGWFEDLIAITGQGFSLFPAYNQIVLGVTPATVAASSPTTMDVAVPLLPPGDYLWEARVGGSKAKAASNFTVTPIDGARIRLTPTISRQTDPAVAAGTSGWLPIWVDDRAGSKVDIYARQVLADGSMPVLDQAVSVAPSDTQRRPDVAYDPVRDRFLVVWQDGPSATDIYGRFVKADGSPDGDMFSICAALDVQATPRVTYAPALDAFCVVWSDRRNGASYEIYAKLVAGDGTHSGSGSAVTASGMLNANPDVAWSAPANSFFVVWDELASTGAAIAKVRGQTLSASGSPVGSAVDVSTDLASHQVEPTIEVHPDTGAWAVVWVTQTKPHEVLVRAVGTDGMPVGTPGSASGPAFFDKKLPRLAYEPWNGKFVVVWAVDVDKDKTVVSLDTYGAFLNDDLTPWGSPFLVAGGTGDQDTPEIAPLSGAKRSLVTYHEWTTGASHLVYAQKLR